MAGKYNRRHDERGRSRYGQKAGSADRYGHYRNGEQVTPDRINTLRDEGDEGTHGG
jgi:hypothetical protein